MPDRTDEPHRRPPFWVRHRKLWPLLLLAPVLLLVASFAIDRARHREHALRGVELAGQSLYGLDRDAGRGVLTRHEAELQSEPLWLSVQGKKFELSPADVELVIDIDGALDAAWQLGREGNVLSQLGWWLASFSATSTTSLSCRVDEAALGTLLQTWETAAVEDPPFEGAVVVEGARAVDNPPKAGHRIDRQSAASAITTALCGRDRSALEVPLAKVEPVRTAATTAKAVARANRLLSGAITLLGELPPAELPKPNPKSRGRAPKPKAKAKAKGEETQPAEPETARFVFSPAAMAAALRSQPDGASGLKIYFDADALEPALAAARTQLERKPVDARFVVERGDKIHIVPSHEGRVIDVDKVAEALLAAAETPEREAAFPIEVGAKPALSTQDAEALNVTGLVSKFTTTHPCCRPRVKNIHKIADLIDGVLLRPGEKFSINAFVGERTARKGFKPAPTIVHGEMKDTVGGGISQFATTFFNAAFYGAYGIVERQPHSYYFSRYPMGHEATLSFPKPDVIIRNDTESGLLIKTYYTGVSITVKMYGDNGGRKVRRKVSKIYDLTDPPIEYIADDSLDSEETKVEVGGKKGWTVTVARVVVFADKTEKKEQRKVVYKPRVRKIRVHSCRIPEGEDGYTGDTCPEPEEEDGEQEDDSEMVGTPGGDAGSEPEEIEPRDAQGE